MKRTFFKLGNLFRQRRFYQACGVGLSLTAVKSFYNNYFTTFCEEEEVKNVAQNQISEANKADDGELEEFFKKNDIILVNKYTDLSDIIVHHKTQSECLVFLPGCSEESIKIMLKSIQNKRDNKKFKFYAFKPSKHYLNDFLLKREQDKEKDLQERLDGVEFFGINSFGDLRYFSLNQNSQINNWKNFMGRNISQQAYFQRIMNFFHPPKVFSEKDYPQLIQNINELAEEDRLIISYIPEEKVYDANLPKFSTFDLYRQGRIKNISQLETRFRDISYEYIEKNTKFIIIRNPDIAQSLSIGKDDIGEIYILKRTLKQMNNESNWYFQGQEYLYNKIEWDPNNDQDIQLNQNQIIEKLYQRSFNYVNAIHTDHELNNLLQSANENGVNKFLIYYSAEAIEAEYEQKLTKKLISVKKNIQDQDFQIIFTKNPLLLKNYFRIIPDKYTDTVRFLDYSSKSQNLDKRLADWTTLAFYSPNNTHSPIPKEQQIANESSVYQKEAEDALRYKYEGKITRNKLSYFVKQSIQQKVQQYYEFDHQSQKYSSIYLNASNFNKEILQNNSDDISLVYFYKPGCPNCYAMHKALEKFVQDLDNIKENINQYEKGLKEYKSYDDNLINQYNLHNFVNLKNIKVYRYNIYNECKEFPSPSASPLVFLFTKDNRYKPTQTDLLKDRVNISDSEKVSRYLFKKIDLLKI
ncbi:hypothetical protein ABPG72_007160 [Tetrahymena utriculariae]